MNSTSDTGQTATLRVRLEITATFSASLNEKRQFSRTSAAANSKRVMAARAPFGTMTFFGVVSAGQPTCASTAARSASRCAKSSSRDTPAQDQSSNTRTKPGGSLRGAAEAHAVRGRPARPRVLRTATDRPAGQGVTDLRGRVVVKVLPAIIAHAYTLLTAMLMLLMLVRQHLKSARRSMHWRS